MSFFRKKWGFWLIVSETFATIETVSVFILRLFEEVLNDVSCNS
ncbi:hypothetical protein HMPREF0541_02962 [Lacticaseibacillus rhamnosus ATCC 21052]|nr:hypothetical protein HMPREF0541_02962 [Lacticaseibacillus rhamnosus ATCC 21052]